MNQKERLAVCSTCTRRKLDFGHGYICQLTGSVADFKSSCKDFKLDESVTDTIKVRTKEREWVPLFDPPPEPVKSKKGVKAKEKLSEVALKKLRRYQSFIYALFGGLLVTLLSAVAWTVVSDLSGYGGVYLALGVGLLVGLALRFFGAGFYRFFGILGFFLTLKASLLGYYLAQTTFLETLQSGELVKLLDILQPELLLSTLQDSFVPLDLLFYIPACLLGYLLAIRRIGAKRRARLESDDYKGAPVLYWLRLPLILAGYLLPAYFGYTMARQGSSGVTTLYYETGEKMSEGEMRRGKEFGEWTSWHENGHIKNIGYFSDGLRDSLWLSYDELGIQICKGMYVLGVENGTWMHYFNDGVVSDSGAYLDGLKEGLWKYFYEEGALKSSVHYKAGDMHGEKVLLTNSGKVVRVQYYENGELIEKNP